MASTHKMLDTYDCKLIAVSSSYKRLSPALRLRCGFMQQKTPTEISIIATMSTQMLSPACVFNHQWCIYPQQQVQHVRVDCCTQQGYFILQESRDYTVVCSPACCQRSSSLATIILWTASLDWSRLVVWLQCHCCLSAYMTRNCWAVPNSASQCPSSKKPDVPHL